MAGSIANFLLLLFPSTGLAVFAWVTAQRLTAEPKKEEVRRWLVSWCLKGVLVPWLLWAVMNFGVSWGLQPFMPQIQAAQHARGPWVPEFIHVLAVGLWVAASYWTAVTLGWLVLVASQVLDPSRQREFKSLCWTCSLGLLLPAAALGYFGGWLWIGAAAALLLAPIAGGSIPLVNPEKLPPIYARAVARMKFGKYSEAEWEIIRELERCEDDFDGWMLLAELYANHFHDLVEAEKTIRDICVHPKVSPSQFAVALHRLADWHLKLAQDPVAAREALQLIVDRFKGSHLARMAMLRLNQIPSTVEEFRENLGVSKFPMPALGDTLDAKPGPPASKLERKQSAQMADSYVQRLRQNPNNAEVRERLARIFAERLDRSELGIEQVELLLGMPDQPDAKRAEWLGLIAAWQFKYRHDRVTGRATLETLVNKYPQTPQALAARYRLEKMAREGVPEGW